MWMRTWIVVEAVAGLAGCAVSPRVGDGSAGIAVELCAKPNLCPAGGPRCGVEDLLCPDGTTNCCSTNGAGVYTAEGGFAGVDVYRSPPVGQPPNVARKIMIPRFVNTGSGVALSAGSFDGNNRWMPIGDGRVLSADLGERVGMAVTAVHETATTPAWHLADARGSLDVVGDQLATLRLHVELPDGWGNLVAATLDFAGPATRGPGELPDVRAYSMRWRVDSEPGPWKPYCLDADRAPDSVVFQEDIAVDPETGLVSQPGAGSTVTLSCLHGAPATVFGWHYPYRGADLYHFASGVQMKRASYCADGRYYTAAGTAIEIADDRHIQNSVVHHLEAWWTPQGASCVNLGNLRHSRLGFTGACDGRTLPPCPGGPAPPPFLIAGPQTPAP